MKIALLAQQIEDLGAEILNITKKNASGDGNVYQIDIAEPASAILEKTLEKAVEHMEIVISIVLVILIGGLATSAVYLNLFDRENENKEDKIE